MKKKVLSKMLLIIAVFTFAFSAFGCFGSRNVTPDIDPPTDGIVRTPPNTERIWYDPVNQERPIIVHPRLDENGEQIFDEEGNGLYDLEFLEELDGINGDPAARSQVDFWGWGDPDEIAVFNRLVREFNEIHRVARAGVEMSIRVNYTQRPPADYSTVTLMALSQGGGPDVFYVGDGDVKSWAQLGVLSNLTAWFDNSPYLDPDDMWSSSVNRYRIDLATMRTDIDVPGANFPLWAVPKDIGPTVIYYNIDAFEAVGVRIISVDAEDIIAFNNGAPDLTGRTRTQIGIPADVAIGAVGYDHVNRIFNNRIAMNWNERDDLAKLLTRSHNPGSPTMFGYFTEWWFAYGWSVGGDVIRFNEDGGHWDFTLGCTHRMWLAADGTFHRYEAQAGEGAIQMQYSQRDAFTRFVQLSQPTNVDVSGYGHYGLAITPTPQGLGAGGKVGHFTAGNTAMLVDIRASTVAIRRQSDFRWDVAPLPVAPGGGQERGHSGSMGIAVNSASPRQVASWAFAQFLAGPVGQAAQASTGFNLPNQISVANTDVFLQPDQHPRNSSIFLRAAVNQTPGDWWYLQDNNWIDQWAPVLNGPVRNATMTIPTFFEQVTARTNAALLLYT